MYSLDEVTVLQSMLEQQQYQHQQQNQYQQQEQEQQNKKQKQKQPSKQKRNEQQQQQQHHSSGSSSSTSSSSLHKSLDANSKDFNSQLEASINNIPNLGNGFGYVPPAQRSFLEGGSDTSSHIDYEQAFLEYLINEENVRERLMNRGRVFVYDEIKLRTAAAAEITHSKNNNSNAGSDKKKRKTCSSEERVLLNRERNREHAQKTRQRKKVYITKLKELIVTLTQQITIINHEFNARGLKISSIQESRKKMLYHFMDLRCNGNVDINQWNDIVSSNITVILPITPYRYYPQHEVLKTEKYRRYVSGIEALINDVHSTEIMMASFLEGTMQWRCSYGFKFKFVTSKISLLDVLCGESTLTAKFSETLSFARETSIPPITYHGFVTCRFNAQNKIMYAELNFDSMGYYAQLQGITNSVLSIAIPNTLELATKNSNQPRAVISAEGPNFEMIYFNEKWSAEASGNEQKLGVSIFENLNLLTDSENQNILTLLTKCCAGIPCSTIVACKNSLSEDKKSYRSVYLKATPLSKSSNSIMTRLNKSNTISNILLVQYVLTINVQPNVINVPFFEGDTGDLDLFLLN